jgi:hypothetical protein
VLDPVERWGQLTLEGNLAFEHGEHIKARQAYGEALAIAEEMMVAGARAHDARAARFAPALYGISCNDIIALARQQDDGLTAGIFLCKLAGGYLSVMECAEAPVSLRMRCLLHSRVASATLCAYFEERGMWDAAETYSARANAAFFSLQAGQDNAAPVLPSVPAELPSLLLPESPPPELSLPAELFTLSAELTSLLSAELTSLLPEPNLPLPEPEPEPSLRLPELPSPPRPRIPRPAQPAASPPPVEPLASSVVPAASSSEWPSAPSAQSVEPPAPSTNWALPTLDAPFLPSGPPDATAFDEGGAAPRSSPWRDSQPELRPSLWSDAQPALDLSPPQPPPRRSWGARLLDWVARALRRSPRSSLPSLGSRSV